MKTRPLSPTSRLWRSFALALSVTLGTLIPASLSAGSHDAAAYAPENIAQIDILPGWRMADGRHMAALRIRLGDGWKTYWRAPGEGGIPPSFDWGGSRNMGAVRLLWPTPDVFDPDGLRTIGYKHELILPLAIEPRQDGEAIIVKGRVALGVCRDVCMPMEASFDAVLPASGVGAGSATIRSALARMPQSGAEAGLGTISCEVEPIADGLRVTARLNLPRVGKGEVAVIEPADQEIWVSPTELSREGNILTLISDLVPPDGKPFLLSRSDIRITVLADGKGVDIASCVNAS